MRKLKLILGKRKGESDLVDAQTGESIDGVMDVHITLERSNAYLPIATVTLVILDIEAPPAVPVSQHKEE